MCPSWGLGEAKGGRRVRLGQKQEEEEEEPERPPWLFFCGSAAAEAPASPWFVLRKEEDLSCSLPESASLEPPRLWCPSLPQLLVSSSSSSKRMPNGASGAGEPSLLTQPPTARQQLETSVATINTDLVSLFQDVHNVGLKVCIVHSSFPELSSIAVVLPVVVPVAMAVCPEPKDVDLSPGEGKKTHSLGGTPDNLDTSLHFLLKWAQN